MNIRYADMNDLDTLSKHDHIEAVELERSISLQRILYAESDGVFIGWLRYGLFWDIVPFMNMLYFLDGYRGKGYGKELVVYWEYEMKKLGYDFIMTSTASDEYAQHFYQKLGYSVVGGFLIKNDPYEIILSKKL